ncbi:MAG: nucleotidyltransferase family protein [Sphingomicrobium sp.]
MTSDQVPIDQLLAAALRGEDARWPSGWSGSGRAAQITERIAYHGIAGLIAGEARRLGDWPADVLAGVREQAIALAMWELRHKAVLGELIAALADAKILALLLKGTALAYDLYPAPANRARGDTDLLIAESDLDPARSILTRLGYRCQPLDQAIANDLALQEVWSLTCDAGTRHHIDLHWQLLNAPALRGVLAFSACAVDPHRLPLLARDALAMNRVLTLLHSCIHRAMHITSPYFVGGVTYYGGDRLIWGKDIDLLTDALSDTEWQRFSAAALDQGVAKVCLDGLLMARRWLGTAVPQPVIDALGAAGAEPPSAYLLDSRQMGRAWQDLLAIRGWRRKLAYLAVRALPSPSFMRGKYPELARWPVAVLHGRRMVDLVRPRPGPKAPR